MIENGRGGQSRHDAGVMHGTEQKHVWHRTVCVLGMPAEHWQPVGGLVGRGHAKRLSADSALPPLEKI